MTSVTVSQLKYAIDTINLNKSVLLTIIDNSKDFRAAANIIKAMRVTSSSTHLDDIVKLIEIVAEARDIVNADCVVQHLERDVVCGDTYYGKEEYVIDIIAGTTTHISVNGKTSVSPITPSECKAALTWFNGLCRVII